jgi:endonuclease YncB( thermonuclease family)
MRFPSLLCLRGSLVVIGKQPDGDSIRFVPDSPDLLDSLRRSWRVRRSSDGSVQLRLEGIDAPETHYGALAQPLGAQARDALLELCGFRDIRRDGEEVVSASPERRPAAILSELVDANGRPVSILLVDEDLPDGEYVEVDDDTLRRTANTALLADGSAYLTLYDSCAPPIRAAFRSTAADARERRLGVWAQDETAGFELVDQDSIGPEGQLVLPKLFRRCSDYLRTRAPDETLRDWLRTHGPPERPEDDRVIVGGSVQTRLSELVEQRDTSIAFPVDLLDIVFVEK